MNLGLIFAVKGAFAVNNFLAHSFILSIQGSITLIFVSGKSPS
jgi:hypothetical protein